VVLGAVPGHEVRPVVSITNVSEVDQRTRQGPRRAARAQVRGCGGLRSALALRAVAPPILEPVDEGAAATAGAARCGAARDAELGMAAAPERLQA